MKEKPSWISNIKFLCFDVDGTLYRNVPEIWNAIQSQIYDKVSRQKDWSLDRTKKEFAKRYQNLGSSTKVLREFGIDAEQFFDSIFANLDFSLYIPRDERLIEITKQLRQTHAVGLLSNGSTPSVTKKLAVLGLMPDQFIPFLTTYEFGVLKPDRAPFLEILRLAGVSPEQSVYIGDRDETDIIPAKTVGMHTIMVWSESQKADLSIPTIYDLEGVFL